MARLILLNGLPGLGKSTLAARYADAGPGRVLVDVDGLRRTIPGDPSATAEPARAQALLQIASSLSTGHDVVVPQLVARTDQLARFEQVARDTGAELVHLVLVDDGDDPVGRFHRRGGADPWHREVRSLVADQGGDEVLRGYATGLADVRAARPDVRVVRSVEGDVDGTWASLRDAVDRP